MTGGDGTHRDEPVPWWVEYDRPPDEQTFVSEVSGALHVPNAAPEIRMIAEIMASMSIPGHAASPPAALTPYLTPESNVIELEPRRLRGMRRLFAAGSAAAVALVALTVSAYAGVLPDSVQDVAHTVIHAPGHHGKHNPGNGGPFGRSATSTPVGPDVSGPAAQGLCTAYAHATRDGSAADRSVAFGNLVAAAGGAQNVAAFCSAAGVPSVAAPPSHTPQAPDVHTSPPAGPPSSHPSNTHTPPGATRGGNPHTSPSGAPASPTPPSTPSTANSAASPGGRSRK
jgi:hypothetical protein